MKLSWPARLYIAAVVAAAAALLIATVRTGMPIPAGHAVLLASLFLLAEAFPVALPRGGGYSVSFVVTLAAMITHGPAVAVIAAAAGALNLRGIRRHPAPVASRIFNGANFMVCTGIAALSYRAVGGPVGAELLAAPITKGLFPVLIATGVNFAANTAIVAVMLYFATPQTRFRNTPWHIWRTEFTSLLPGYFSFAFLGLLLGVLYMEVHAAAVLFVLVPLLVARRAFAAAVRAQLAYETTMESLVTALEAKDRYTRDHAARVSRLTEMVAREHGVRGEQLRTFRLAALMHDVGKVGVPTAVLAKPGKLTPDEYVAMKDHPIRGHEIVTEIALLKDALAGIRHHHERMDGSGYPDGLTGDEIPLVARIIMVCDAFDSMTSTRTYRVPMTMEEALAELRRCAGTQFDPAAVDALETALAKNPWRAEPEIERLRRLDEAKEKDNDAAAV
ncbi:MAG TPA: HD-GYP domain-containing protein [Actinomycetota bacterium]|nr:HD-GYP domain-containing protein [Actinomycetota bacterium]